MDFDVYLRFMFALVLVLALIGALTWAARRFGLGGQLTPNTGKSPRLAGARIVYGGRGQISDVQKPRYGQQICDIIWPF